jgi:predicted phage terminase large subunit-like protein
MTTTSDPAASPDPLAGIINFALPFANVDSIPLPLVNLPDDTLAVISQLHARQRAATRLVDYADTVVLDDDTSPALHHRVICDAIDALLDDEYDDLVICTPPGAAKSTYTSHALGSYFMGRYPRRNVILATHTADLSEKWSRKVRNTLADPRHGTIFPDSQLSRDSTAVGRWATSLGGEFLAVGVGASILGFRADCAIIDDPLSGYEQAQSETQLQKVHDWFETDLITRLKPLGKIVLICQRLAANDLAGYLIQRNALNPTRRLRVLTLRMEAEPEDAEDGTGRSPGDRLWPEWFTPEMVADAKRDDYKWRTLYQQRPPSSSGDWVGPEHIQIVDIVPSNLSHYLVSDLALSVNKGDYSVHIACGVDSAGKVFVEDAWRERCAVERTVEKHLDMIEAHSPLESLIDDDNASKVYVQFLAARARERGVPVPWRVLPMRGQDKETRAAPLRGMFRSNRIALKRAGWNEWLVRELLVFPNAMGEGVDDGVDALSLIGRRLAALARPASAAPPPRPSPTIYDMTLDQLHEDRERTRTLRRI